MNRFRQIRKITRAMQKVRWGFPGNSTQIRTTDKKHGESFCPITCATYYYTNKYFRAVWYQAAAEQIDFNYDSARAIAVAADFPSKNQLNKKQEQLRKILLRAARLTEQQGT